MDIEINYEGSKKVNAVIAGYTVKTDQRTAVGGDGDFPTPFELFLASFGTCAGYYVRSFCDLRKISTENIKLFLHVERDNLTKAISEIGIEIALPEDFPAKYKHAVIAAAEECAVKKLIQDPPEFDVYTSNI